MTAVRTEVDSGESESSFRTTGSEVTSPSKPAMAPGIPKTEAPAHTPYSKTHTQKQPAVVTASSTPAGSVSKEPASQSDDPSASSYTESAESLIRDVYTFASSPKKIAEKAKATYAMVLALVEAAFSILALLLDFVLKAGAGFKTQVPAECLSKLLRNSTYRYRCTSRQHNREATMTRCIVWYIFLRLARVACITRKLAEFAVNSSLPYNHHPHNSLHHTRAHNMILSVENTLIETAALIKMKESLDLYKNSSAIIPLFPNNFVDIEKSYLVHPQFVHNSDGRGNTEKFFVGRNAIPKLGKSFVVYAAGIDNDPEFENYMARNMNTSVFAFDCTNEPHKEWVDINFYSWCIGQKVGGGLDGSVYNRPEKNYTFLSLGEIKGRLNHTFINMLKMDIEGYEWDILQSVATTKYEDLPLQLLFELHTEGANRRYVPAHIVKGRGRQQVTQLIYDLFKRGYRVINMELNIGDHHCAEFALLLVE